MYLVITGGVEYMTYKDQIGCCFNIDGQEWIYEGIQDNSNGAYACNNCGKELKGKYHLFNSVEGYNEGNYESMAYGIECIKSIIQLGYEK